MDIKDSYLHGTVGVVKSIDVDADKLTYKLADINNTARTITLPLATQTANGLLSSEDKAKLDNLEIAKIGYTQLTNEDLNTLTEEGKWYYAWRDNQTSNIPEAINNIYAYELYVGRIGSKVIYQKMITSTGVIFFRMRTYSNSSYIWGSWKRWYTDKNTDSKVEQITTTADSDYRILLSNTATDDTETNSVNKSSKLTFNPTSETLTIRNLTTANVILNNLSLLHILDTLQSEINAVNSKTNYKHLVTELLDSDVISSNYLYSNTITGTDITATNITAALLKGALDGLYINKLTGYTKAAAASDLVATDTLNQALGKLEYKADTTYRWYQSITEDDTDDIINKWDEIVDFIDNVKEGTDITDEFVTRKTDLVITGIKTFKSWDTSELTINRGHITTDIYTYGGWAKGFTLRNTSGDTTVAASFGVLGNGIGSEGTSINYIKYLYLAHQDQDHTTATFKVYGDKATILNNEVYHKGNLKNLSDLNDDLLSGKYLPLSGGTMRLGEGLKFHADENYFGSSLDARIISLLDYNDSYCDGGLIIDERTTKNGTEYITELLRIRHTEFKWKGNNIWHEGNDGSSSGLDADLLDGQHGDWYLKNCLRFLGFTPETRDANTVTEGILTNYNDSNAWLNAPEGMSYGSILTLKHSLSDKLSGQLAWDIRHANTTDTTRNLWWRATDLGDWIEAKWHLIAFTDSNITGNADTATKLKEVSIIPFGSDTVNKWYKFCSVLVNIRYGNAMGLFLIYTGRHTGSHNSSICNLGFYFYQLNPIGNEPAYKIYYDNDNTSFEIVAIFNHDSNKSTLDFYIRTLISSYYEVRAVLIGGSCNLTSSSTGLTELPSGTLIIPSYTRKVLKAISADKLTLTFIVSNTYSLSNALWTDTWYAFTSLTSGTYAVQVTSGSNLVASGIMSVCTNLEDTVGDEIPLHVYGTAGWRPYLRTYANKLLISSNDTASTARTVTIKIALII